MKKKLIVFGVLLGAGLLLWLFFAAKKPPVVRSTSSESPQQKQSVGAEKSSGHSATAGKQISKEEEADAAEEAASDARKEQEIRESHAEHNRLYATAIEFYGVVLDLEGRPVPQAEVKYMNADPTGKWTWKEMSSASDGSFAISGVRGRYLDVQVSHADYYVLPESNRSFTYAGNDRGPDFKPDPAKPEVFRLKKKGHAAELIRNDSGVFFNKDEKERSFSLIDHSRRRDRPEYVVIGIADNGRKNANGERVLDLKLITPSGGLQLRPNAFQYGAPADGYKPTLTIEFPVIFPVDVFVRFSSGNYGRFTIAGGAGQYDVESYLNPDKSPNLEYDPAKEITVIRNGKMGVDLLYPAKGGRSTQN